MKSVKISLEMAQKVKDFVKIVQDYPYEILLKSAFSASTSPSRSPLRSIRTTAPIF